MVFMSQHECSQLSGSSPMDEIYTLLKAVLKYTVINSLLIKQMLKCLYADFPTLNQICRQQNYTLLNQIGNKLLWMRKQEAMPIQRHRQIIAPRVSLVSCSPFAVPDRFQTGPRRSPDVARNAPTSGTNWLS